MLKRLSNISVTLKTHNGDDSDSWKLVTLNNKLYYWTNIDHICPSTLMFAAIENKFVIYTLDNPPEVP